MMCLDCLAGLIHHRITLHCCPVLTALLLLAKHTTHPPKYLWSGLACSAPSETAILLTLLSHMTLSVQLCVCNTTKYRRAEAGIDPYLLCLHCLWSRTQERAWVDELLKVERTRNAGVACQTLDEMLNKTVKGLCIPV